MESSHQLVAIMFTDIVGYTAMMGENEEQAMEVVSKYEDTILHETKKNKGDVINFYGDGSLSVFKSVNHALNCACSIQHCFRSQMDIPLRIGLHMGEAIFQKGNVYGDAVNLASRIESMGQAGAVLFSEDIHSRISDRTSFNSELLGSFEFKNVKKPLNVYALSSRGLRVPEKNSLTGKLKVKDSAKDKSIAVMPFVNASLGNELDYFVDGISDEIRSQLLSIDGLKVISRSSSIPFKNKEYSLRDLSTELNVKYVVEGRVQIQGDLIKVNIDLSNTHTDKQLWSLPALNSKMEDLFDLQNKVALAVANELRIIMTDKEKHHLAKVATHNMDAVLAYQKGMDLLHRGHGKIEELRAALECFEEAIAIDPNFSKAYIGICDAYLDYIFWGRASVKDSLDLALKSALTALQIDDRSGESLGALGAINFFKHRDILQAKHFLKQAIKLSPSYLGAYEKLAWVYTWQREYDKAREMFIRAQELDPLSTKFIGDVGHTYYYCDRFDDGLNYIDTHLKKHPKDPWLLWMKAYLLSGAERYEEAVECLSKRTTSGQNSNWMLGYNYGKLGKLEEAKAILEFHLNKRKLDFVPAYMIATIYAGLGDTENTMKWLETDHEDGGNGLIFMGLNHDPKFKDIEDLARFKKLSSFYS